MTRKSNRYWESYADEGLPQDWGDPEDSYVNDSLRTPHRGFGNWRYVIVELTADERVTLNRWANDQNRDTDDMAASLIRQALKHRKAQEEEAGLRRRRGHAQR